MQSFHLYYFSWFLHKSLLGSITDDFLSQLENNDNIIFLGCRGSLLPCSGNNSFSKAKCKECIFNQKHSIIHEAIAENNIKLLYVDQFVDRIEAQQIYESNNYTYSTVDDIKGLNYKGAEIGYGALSSYVSWTRNKEPIIDLEFRIYFDSLLVQQILLTEVFFAILNIYNIKKISIFNGRRADVRPFYDLSKLNHIEIRNVENFRMVNTEYDSQRLEVYPNTMPQDTNYHRIRMEQAWRNSREDESFKIEKGTFFFEAKRTKKPLRQVRSFVNHQNAEELPEGFDERQWNIVIFNSSDDEFVALGKEFENPIFKTQKEGIAYISRFYKNYSNVKIYLKMHPNLKGVKYDYHLGLYPLGKAYTNLTVIPSESTVSTYALLDNANLVITFNSSLSLEANFIKKPVIMLGTFYSSLNIAYYPSSFYDLNKLLENFKSLSHKDRINSIKYGYYMSNPDSYSKPVNNKPRKLKMAGCAMHVFPHLKIWNSSILFRIVHSFLNLFLWQNNDKKVPTRGK